jgi:hypothetical protein
MNGSDGKGWFIRSRASPQYGSFFEQSNESVLRLLFLSQTLILLVVEAQYIIIVQQKWLYN